MKMSAMKVPHRPTSFLGSLGGCFVIFLFVGVIGSCAITIGIWPGEIKLLAPWFCTDAQPDAFVVADTYSPQPGETVTNFTLYCMGPRGDATDKGFLWPFLAISAVNGFVICGSVFVLSVLTSLSRRSRSSGGPDDGDDRDDRDDFSDLSDLGESRQGNAPTSPFGSKPLSPGSTAGPFVD